MKIATLILLLECTLSSKISISQEIYELSSELEDFAVEIRYPDSSFQLSDEEVKQAIKISKMLRGFVLNEMNLIIDYNDIKKD